MSFSLIESDNVTATRIESGSKETSFNILYILCLPCLQSYRVLLRQALTNFKVNNYVFEGLTQALGIDQ